MVRLRGAGRGPITVKPEIVSQHRARKIGEPPGPAPVERRWSPRTNMLLPRRCPRGDSSAMCVLAFAWQAHPRWPLVVAGNRDELHDRPTAPLARWEEADHLIAGRDLQSDGTWLGVSERGRFAVVTNLRGFGAPE